MNITLYIKNNCRQCTQTKKTLDKMGLSYQTVNVETDTEAYDYVVNRLGYKAAPVVVVIDDDEQTAVSWAGFNPEMIAATFVGN